MTIAVIAAKAGVTPHAIYHHVHAGHLPVFKIGQVWVSHPKDVEAFLAKYFRGEFDRRGER
jgi:hypothetical protein